MPNWLSFDELGLNLLNCDGLSAEPVDFAGVPKVIDIESPSAENPLGRGVTRSNVSADILPYDNGKEEKGVYYLLMNSTVCLLKYKRYSYY